MTGQDLIRSVQAKLGGYANAASPQVILGHLNEGKDEVWAILKSLNEQYFTVYTQSTDSNADAYFGPMTTTQREYDLPSDFREIKFIEVIQPTWPDTIRFVYRKMTHPDWAETRRLADTASAASSGSAGLWSNGTYYYTIVGSDPFKLVLADYLETAVTPVIWYTRAIPEIEMETEPEGIISPYNRKIADFACKRILLANDQAKFEAWRTEWRDDIIMIAESAGPVNQANPTFASDFEG